MVDDEPAVGASLRRVLSKSFEVVILFDARLALEAIRHGDRFDAILCDLSMPEMTGFELHAQLLIVAPEQANRMLFLTGGPASEAASAFIEDHASRCLIKPFQVSELRARIDAIVYGPAR